MHSQRCCMHDQPYRQKQHPIGQYVVYCDCLIFTALSVDLSMEKKKSSMNRGVKDIDTGSPIGLQENLCSQLETTCHAASNALCRINSIYATALLRIQLSYQSQQNAKQKIYTYVINCLVVYVGLSVYCSGNRKKKHTLNCDTSFINYCQLRYPYFFYAFSQEQAWLSSQFCGMGVFSKAAVSPNIQLYDIFSFPLAGRFSAQVSDMIKL